MAWLHTRREFGDGTSMSRDVAYRALLDCSKRGDLELGRLLYLQMINNGLDSVTVLANHIIRFFSSSGTLIEANQAFSKVSLPDQYTWNAIFDAHSKLGEGHLALGIYDQMQDERDRYTFFSVLKGMCNMAEAILPWNVIKIWSMPP